MALPAIPAAALIRKLARGETTARGAMPCLGLLMLAEIEAEWQHAGLRVAAGWGEDGAGLRPSLYRRALGAAYGWQSMAGQELHDAGRSRWTGRCTVDGAQTAAGHLLARLFQLPAPAVDVPIVVEFAASDGGEVWTRRIGGRVMRSRHYIGRRKPSGWVVEQFGPFAFDLKLSAKDSCLDFVLAGMRFCGVPLPSALWPRINADESEEEGRFRFDVKISLPLVGRLVRYRGWLTNR